MSVRDKFGKRLKELRLRAGMSQARLAEELNVVPQCIGSWEQGRTLPSLDILEDLALTLSTTPADLIAFEPGVQQNTETNLVRIPCTGQEPKRAHYDDAASDIRSAENVTIKPGKYYSVKTGLRIALKPGYVALLFGRSGNGQRGIGITHGVGVIDAGFRGEIKVCLYNLSDEDFVIEEGDRIAQLMIIPVPFTWFMELDNELFDERFSESSRGTAGYGSTGRN